jgi:hypothetical protein
MALPMGELASWLPIHQAPGRRVNRSATVKPLKNLKSGWYGITGVPNRSSRLPSAIREPVGGTGPQRGPPA